MRYILLELVVIIVVVVFASSAFAGCLDVAGAYQAAAALRDRGTPPRDAYAQLKSYPKITEAERRDAILNAWRHPYQSASSAYRAGLAHCEGWK